ncbi:MAG TPA: hypothetical protein EYG73_02525 [Arcobacter sp.]|nr:hypothetical protein [Arcobacter sp.]
MKNLELDARAYKALYGIMSIAKMSKLASNNINANEGNNSLEIEDFEEVFGTIELLGKEALEAVSGMSDKLDL